MVTPAHNRITLSGVFGTWQTPAEIWSIGLNTGPRLFASDADRLAVCTAVDTAYDTNLKALMPNTVHLTNVRISQHLEGGNTSMGEQGEYHQTDKPVLRTGTVTTFPTWPLSTALCVSLTTARAGATGKGRVFLPWPAKTLSSDFRMTITDADAIAAAFKAFIVSINSVVGSPGSSDDVAVVSSKGYLSRVTGVRVGRVPDTMRSRRSNLVESYSVLGGI